VDEWLKDEIVGDMKDECLGLFEEESGEYPLETFIGDPLETFIGDSGVGPPRYAECFEDEGASAAAFELLDRAGEERDEEFEERKCDTEGCNDCNSFDIFDAQRGETTRDYRN
jgi:hypothetical protein